MLARPVGLNRPLSFRSKWTGLADLARAGLGCCLESLNLMHHFCLKWAVSPRCHTQVTPVTVKSTNSRSSRAALAGCNVQVSFKLLPDWRCCSLSGPLIWHLTILGVDTFYTISNQNFPCCNLCLLPLVLSLCFSKDSLALSSARPPIKSHRQQ